MSSQGTRQRSLPVYGKVSNGIVEHGFATFRSDVLATGKQITVSESNPINRKTGKYDSGGPFYTSRVDYHFNDGSVSKAYRGNRDMFYSGPVRTILPTLEEQVNVGFKATGLAFGDKNESQMLSDGTIAISRSSPINPASNLGTSLAETFREGLPSLPGIQSWKRRTEIAKAAGSEYLNYQFGWAPLKDEVHKVSNAASHHADIMKQYQKGEGSNTHRTYEFPLQSFHNTIASGTTFPEATGMSPFFHTGCEPAQRQISLVRETKKWFEGCFTYGLPSSTDSWREHLGFGSEAGQVLGLNLTPTLLWELTPWSWAVDWFSNSGEVINNVTNFGLAGLVMRYGYMMEETIEKVTAEVGKAEWLTADKLGGPAYKATYSTPCSSSISLTTKRRVPASPFGFSVGWEGLSPTQLAITAALGITKLL